MHGNFLFYVCARPWKPSNATNPYFSIRHTSMLTLTVAHHILKITVEPQMAKPLSGQSNLSSYDILFGVTKVYSPLQEETGDGTRILNEGLSGNTSPL